MDYLSEDLIAARDKKMNEFYFKTLFKTLPDFVQVQSIKRDASVSLLHIDLVPRNGHHDLRVDTSNGMPYGAAWPRSTAP